MKAQSKKPPQVKRERDTEIDRKKRREREGDRDAAIETDMKQRVTLDTYRQNTGGKRDHLEQRKEMMRGERKAAQGCSNPDRGV